MRLFHRRTRSFGFINSHSVNFRNHTPYDTGGNQTAYPRVISSDEPQPLVAWTPHWRVKTPGNASLKTFVTRWTPDLPTVPTPQRRPLEVASSLRTSCRLTPSYRARGARRRHPRDTPRASPGTARAPRLFPGASITTVTGWPSPGSRFTSSAPRPASRNPGHGMCPLALSPATYPRPPSSPTSPPTRTTCGCPRTRAPGRTFSTSASRPCSTRTSGA